MKILDKKVRVKVEVKMILLDSGLPEIKQMQFAPRQDTLLKTTLKHAAIHISVLHNRSSLLTYSMQQSPSWEANWFSANQEILRILWNPKVHYRTHKHPPEQIRILKIKKSGAVPRGEGREVLSACETESEVRQNEYFKRKIWFRALNKFSTIVENKRKKQ